ncbi:hypothetical protein VKT23_012089 [Stygiomarasmius scandens]|uniref:Uncharacterized protein n=1 Tax=Marasmiellus scandens TaxID=2682957 RepID=A0ABR1JBJ1_9AGAR
MLRREWSYWRHERLVMGLRGGMGGIVGRIVIEVRIERNYEVELLTGYIGYKNHFGKEQALKILQNEMDTLNLLNEVIDKEGIDCDFWRGRSFDIAMDKECADFFHESLQEFIADGGPTEGIVEWIGDAEEAKKVRILEYPTLPTFIKTPKAFAAAEFPASSLWPYKLVKHLLLLCIDKHNLNLQTNTPARSVSQTSNGDWSIHTDRGDIKAKKVVFASNV